jgi:outer membrane receptor protein involved in Fe transport
MGVRFHALDPVYGPNLIDQSQNNSEKLGLKLTLNKEQMAGLPFNFVYGLDMLVDETWQSLIRTGRTWVPKSRYENYAPFLQTEFTGVDRLLVTAGVRHEEARLEVGDFLPHTNANCDRRYIANRLTPTIESLSVFFARMVLGSRLIEPLRSNWSPLHALI